MDGHVTLKLFENVTKFLEIVWHPILKIVFVLGCIFVIFCTFITSLSQVMVARKIGCGGSQQNLNYM